MFNRFVLGAAALAVFAGVALADTTGSTPPPAPNDQAQMQNQDDQPQDGAGWGWWGHRHGGHRMHGQDIGGPGMGRPGMMAMMRGTGFHLSLGNGVDVGLMCGTMPMKDCIAAAQPLIDAAKAVASAAPAAKTP